MRLAAIVLLLLSSLLMAETQADIYFRAMKAEEAGDIPAALELFEQAVEMGGEYTEEIQEIIDEYKAALGEDEKTHSVSLRLLGDVGYNHLFYSESGGFKDFDENEGDAFVSTTGFVDLSVGNWIHSFGVSFVGDLFVANDGVSALDTNDWTIAPGLEYSLVGTNVLLDAGLDFNKPNKSKLELSLYAWLELDFKHWEKQRAGMALWAYNRGDGPTSFALYGSWHRTASVGFNASVYVGARYEADSLADILGFLSKIAQENASSEPASSESDYGQYDPWNQDPQGGWDSRDPYGQQQSFEYYMNLCQQEHGDECFDLSNGLVESYMYQQTVDTTTTTSEDLVLDSYWTRWIGPSIRARLAYKFRSKIALEGKLNLFYGFVVDGASDVYEDLSRFSGTWGATVKWNPNFLTFYLGVEQVYVRYSVPAELDDYYPDNTSLLELKAGVKFEL